MTLYIRTEANRTTATGHMTRCIAIAKEIRAMGGEVVFIIAESVSEKLPKEAGFEYICLDRVWDDFDGEIPVILDLIEEKNIEYMLVDSYYVSSEYMKTINGKVKTAYIDDLHDRVWPVGAIINYAVYYDLFDYDKEYPNSHKLLGCSYMPLRPEYVGVQPDIRLKCKNILVVTGGGDEFHFIKNLIDLVSADSALLGYHFTFICGAFNVDYDELSARYTKEAGYKNITLLKAVPSLKDYLLQSDLLVSAGGTTLYEAAICQVPTITFRIADNQNYNVTSFGQKGLAIDAGDVRYDFSYENLIKEIKNLCIDTNLRAGMRAKQQETLDGNGARRLADFFMNEWR